MEALKVFLDVPNMLFVLAIDFSVVVQGVKAKYEGMGDEKGRSFFDKIIQVPFNLPVSLYSIGSLVRQSLDQLGLGGSETEGEGEGEPVTGPDYVALVEQSVGTNPRSVKRLLNTFTLLHTIGKELAEDTQDSDEGDPSDKDVFAILCLQEAFPDFFTGMVRSLSRAKSGEHYFRTLAAACEDPGEAAEIDDEVLKAVKALTDYQRSVVAGFVDTLLNLFGFGSPAEDSGAEERLAIALKRAAVTAVGLTSSESASVPTSTYGKEVPRDERFDRLRGAKKEAGLAPEKIENLVKMAKAFEDELENNGLSVEATVSGGKAGAWNYKLTPEGAQAYQSETGRHGIQFASLQFQQGNVRVRFGSTFPQEVRDTLPSRGKGLPAAPSLSSDGHDVYVKRIVTDAQAGQAATLVAEAFKEAFPAKE